MLLRVAAQRLSLRHTGVAARRRVCFRPAAFASFTTAVPSRASALPLAGRGGGEEGGVDPAIGSVYGSRMGRRCSSPMQPLPLRLHGVGLGSAAVPSLHGASFWAQQCQSIAVTRGFASGRGVDGKDSPGGGTGGGETSEGAEKGKEQKEEKLSTFGKIRNMASKYGKVFVIYWGGMYVTHLALVFGAIQLSGLDGLALLRQLGECGEEGGRTDRRWEGSRGGGEIILSLVAIDLGDSSPLPPTPSRTGAEEYIGGYVDISGEGTLTPNIVNLIVAGEINELLEFGRLPFAIATTPRVHRWWHGLPEPGADPGAEAAGEAAGEAEAEAAGEGEGKGRGGST